MCDDNTTHAIENYEPPAITTITMTSPTPVVAEVESSPSADGSKHKARLETVFSKTLSLEIPLSEPSSSITSSTVSSPTGNRDSLGLSATGTSSTTTTSCSSLSLPNPSASTTPTGPPLNVKFAPLPELAPRKRRSSVPLGMAARSQLVRRKRGQQNFYQRHLLQDVDSPSYHTGNSPMWTEEELAEAKARQAATIEKEKKKEEAKRLKPSPYEKGSGEDDPLQVFGKKVQQIWKKVSHKDMKKNATVEGREGQTGGEKRKSKESMTSMNGDGRTPSGYSAPNSSNSQTPIDPDAPLRSILIASSPPPPLIQHRYPEIHEEAEEEEGGGVWEEEIDPHFPLNASQAEATDSLDAGLFLPSASPSESSSASFASLTSDSTTSSQQTKRLSRAWASASPPQLEPIGISVFEGELNEKESTGVEDRCETPTKNSEGSALTVPVVEVGAS